MKLDRCQAQAIESVRCEALSDVPAASRSMREILYLSDLANEDPAELVQSIRDRTHVALHFHPDRIAKSNFNVIESLLLDGVYKNQFETHLSNGYLFPFEGGLRDEWERGLFGNAYSAANASMSQRPKYGGYDLMGAPDGPCPRFGSCYLLLHPRMASRCTFTFLDSYLKPKLKATADTFEVIMAALLREAFERETAIGVRGIRPPALIRRIRSVLESDVEQRAHWKASRNLDHYIETQVHGPVRLQEDVAVLALDASYRDTPIEKTAREACRRYELQLQWQPVKQVGVDGVPNDFRGPVMPELAARVARDGRVDARSIGEAAVRVVRQPENWRDMGDEEECLRLLKWLWHVVVRFGSE